MLSDTQKDNLSGLLYLLDPTDILSLANTVTNYLISPMDYEEAVTTILQYTDSVTTLMSRKKITKELVFRYLHQNQVDGISPSLDKRAMIELLMSHWGENASGPKSNTSFKSIKSDQSDQEPAAPPLPQPTDCLQEMAENFAKWFYSLINHGLGGGEGTKFGPEHFWPDCRLLISLQNPSLQIQEERESGYDAAILLAQMRSHFNLMFNPNLSAQGTQGMSEPHGAVVVTVYGTVHQEELCAGVFEQRFLLLRDPNMQNNWRIKRTEMYLKSGSGGSSSSATTGSATLAMIKQ